MIKVVDDVLFYVEQCRNRALEAKYSEIDSGTAPVEGTDWFQSALRTSTQVPIRVQGSFFIKLPAGKEEQSYIRNDVSESYYTAILFLSHTHPEEDGVNFWRHRGSDQCASAISFTGEQGKDISEWELIKRVPMRFNRAVVFDSRLYHSASLRFGFGEGDHARLIQKIYFGL